MKYPSIFKRASSLPFIAAFTLSLLGASAMADGGVSGGGGGVVPADPVSPASIRNAIQQSRLSLYLFFNNQNLLRRSVDIPSANLLFDGARTIFDVIQTASIELNENGSCLNQAHEEKDGTAPGSKPNSICISVKNLSDKLTVDNYWNQTIALVGHEFSHLLGTDETQAAAIQKSIIGIFRRLPSTLASDMRINGASQLAQVLSSMTYLKAYPAYYSEDPARLNQLFLQTKAEFNSILNSKVLFTEGLSALDSRQTDLWWGAFWKLQMLSYTACSRDHSPSNPRDEICQKWINETFRTDVELTLPALERRMNGRTHGQNPPGFTIRRITNGELFNQELSDLVQILSDLDRILQSLPAVWSGYEPGVAVTPSTNSIAWKTDRVSFVADDFRITTDGMNFYGNPSGGHLHSDPGTQTYWTFEATWFENGREMRLNIYFKANATHWGADEIRTYDGQAESNWITYKGRFFESPLGAPFVGDLDLNGKSESGAPSTLHLRNLWLQTLLH